jgi:hypothetical protein
MINSLRRNSTEQALKLKTSLKDKVSIASKPLYLAPICSHDCAKEAKNIIDYFGGTIKTEYIVFGDTYSPAQKH